MPLARTRAVALVGVQGHLVEVEADLGQGVPSFSLVGLPDTSLAESRDRVRAAVVNSDQPWPATRRITVNLSPASLPKRGSSFDLAIAAAVLAAQAAVPAGVFDRAVLLGELGLDGRVRPVRGVLPAVAAAARRASRAWWSRRRTPPRPRSCRALRVTGVRSLRELVALARSEPRAAWTTDDDEATERGSAGLVLSDSPTAPAAEPDLRDVLGQATARFAMEVAAAGRPPRAHARPAGRRQDDARRAAARAAARRWTPPPRSRSPRCTPSPAPCRPGRRW